MKINVLGCALMDHLFTGIHFDSPEIAPFLSICEGDGGITPGKLVFAEDLEKFAGKPCSEIIRTVSGGRPPDAVNLGGPGIVGAVNAAQLLPGMAAEFHFYGAAGDDATGRAIREIASKTPLHLEHYAVFAGETPETDVLSDAHYHGGKGERSFINRIGAAGQVLPETLDRSFFEADILWFAATALLPGIHDAMTSLVKKGRAGGKLNIVSTVFDFRNEKKDPVRPWPLGESTETYQYIDLLIVDREEALRLSGERDLEKAAAFFARAGVSSLFITRGAEDFLVWSDGRLFRKTGMDSPRCLAFPVSALADRDMAEHPERRGDTTGCGDNFAGGVVASLVRQLLDGARPGDLCFADAAAWGASSGGAACFYKGGTFLEKFPGEKCALVGRYAEDYLQNPRMRPFLKN